LLGAELEFASGAPKHSFQYSWAHSQTLSDAAKQALSAAHQQQALQRAEA